jgi:hypothetical protein
MTGPVEPPEAYLVKNLKDDIAKLLKKGDPLFFRE